MPEMSQNTVKTARRRYKSPHRGRGEQVLIYFGKLLRMFVYQNDWKVLPMAAVIAGLIGLVIRKEFGLTMEGTLRGSFALTCVAIWNGCFNSIQVICRERNVIKREHRSGMHISSYIVAHMLYQALLCAAQSGLMIFVCRMMEVNFPKEGIVTRYYLVDLFITLFLITYASDMLSLFISAVVRNTTTAMTVMPFILIFQLVFSGGIFELPAWSDNISRFMISSNGLKCVASLTDFNEMPLVTPWAALTKIKDNEVNVSFTLGQVMDTLTDEDIRLVKEIRDYKLDDLLADDAEAETPEAAESGKKAETEESPASGSGMTVGDLIDEAVISPGLEEYRDELIRIPSTTVGEMIEIVGEDYVRELVQTETAKANRREFYERTKENVTKYWAIISLFTLAFAFLAMLVLERIDKDRR